MSVRRKTTTTVDLSDVEIMVEYRSYPACRGARDSTGAPIEPDDDPEIEIESAILSTVDIAGKNVKIEISNYLSGEAKEKLIDKIFNHLADNGPNGE